MSCCCSNPCAAIDKHFDGRVAHRELEQYRKKGPGPTAKLLRDGIAAAGEPDATLLDIGAGVGALTFELLEHGVQRAVSVDASAAFAAVGREEAARRNRADRVEWIHGDFVALAETLSAADIVTLDRVVCCYPRFEPLLAAAASHARHCLAISYPRSLWYVRAVMALENAVRAWRKSEFRVLVHPPREMEKLVLSHGFTLLRRRRTWVWSADVYVKASQAT